MSASIVKHLREVDHPYYCATGNFYSIECHANFESWEEFATPTGTDKTGFIGNVLFDWDDDLNFLFRWDWNKADADNYFLSPGDPDDETAAFEEASKTDTLNLFFMAQRKGRNMSASVTVTEADEPAVREWLTKKAEYMRTIWAPLLDGTK